MELKPLQQFAVLAEELHFGRAAARLHMTQPPLTQAMQRLEREMGTSLFVRTQRNVALSPAGAALLPVVHQLLRLAASLPASAQAAALGQAGRLRLAFVSTIAYGPLPQWLSSFRLAQPGIALDLREATLDVQLQGFEAANIDAGFVLHAKGGAPTGLQAWRAWREPLMLALPQDHVLAQRRQLSLAALAAQPLVIFPRAVAPSLFDAIATRYAAVQSTPQIVQEATQMQTIVNLVSAGMGIAWVPRSLTLLQRPGVVYRPLAGAALWCETSLVWPHDAGPVVRSFVEHVKRQPPQSTALASTLGSALVSVPRKRR